MNIKSLKSVLVGLALFGTAVVGTAHALPAAHAGGAPVITVSVQNGSVIHVSGSGFGSGDKVLVEAFNNDGAKLAAYAYVTSTVGGPPCQGGGFCLSLLPGWFSLNLASQ